MIEYKIIKYTKASGDQLFECYKKRLKFLWFPLGTRIRDLDPIAALFGLSGYKQNRGDYVTSFIEEAKYLCMADAKKYFDEIAKDQGEKIISVNSELLNIGL